MAIVITATTSTATDLTLLDIISTALVEVGLEAPTTVIGNTDPLVKQCLCLLISAGNELYRAHPWEYLNKEWSISTLNGVDSYDLPVDWGYFVDQTQWDRTNHWPLLGAKTAQEWQWLKGGLISQGPRTRYRVRNKKFWLHPVPGNSSLSIYMEYISSFWVADNAVTSAKSTFTLDTDKVYVDAYLLIKYLKYKIWSSKGFDSTNLLSEFRAYFDELTTQDKPAMILNMSPRLHPILIGVRNIPDGSWQVGS